MRRLSTAVLAMLLFSNTAFAGPLREAINHAAQTTRPAKASTGENKMLWPGITLLSLGGLVALYGFSHVTGGDVTTNATGTSISVSEKHSTGVGVAGLAIAGAGGFLLVHGQNQARPDRKVSVQFNRVTIRF
jgi:hypothetical protein